MRSTTGRKRGWSILRPHFNMSVERIGQVDAAQVLRQSLPLPRVAGQHSSIRMTCFPVEISITTFWAILSLHSQPTYSAFSITELCSTCHCLVSHSAIHTLLLLLKPIPLISLVLSSLQGKSIQKSARRPKQSRQAPATTSCQGVK